MHAEEVVPEEVAHPQQAGQRLQHLRALQGGQLVGPVGAHQQVPDELAEMQQGRFGVGGAREQVGEVLDQDRGGSELPLFLGRSDLLPPGIGDVEGVVHPVADGLDDHARDVDAGEGQRVGEFIEEPHGVRRLDAQHGIARGGGVIDLDVDGVEGGGPAGHIL